jgi:hypothetical protein
VNVTAPAGVDVLLDKQSIKSQLHAIGAGEYVGGAVAVKAGSHVIQSQSPIGIAVYGLAPYTSYMYPGGLDIKPINKQ